MWNISPKLVLRPSHHYSPHPLRQCERILKMNQVNELESLDGPHTSVILAKRHVGYGYKSDTLATEVIAKKNQALKLSTAPFLIIICLFFVPSRCWKVLFLFLLPSSLSLVHVLFFTVISNKRIHRSALGDLQDERTNWLTISCEGHREIIKSPWCCCGRFLDD